MAELLRLSNIPGAGVMQKDKLGSPSTGSEDGGNACNGNGGGAVGGTGADGLVAESTQDLAGEQDEFDGPALHNGKHPGTNGLFLVFAAADLHTRSCRKSIYSRTREGTIHARTFAAPADGGDPSMN